MKDDSLTKELIKFGFNKLQAKLYLSGLRKGPSLMAELAREAGIKRTTVYYLMEEMIRRGYFSEKKSGRRTHYVAVAPKQLQRMVEQRQRLITKILPSLNSINKDI